MEPRGKNQEAFFVHTAFIVLSCKPFNFKAYNSKQLKAYKQRMLPGSFSLVPIWSSNIAEDEDETIGDNERCWCWVPDIYCCQFSWFWFAAYKIYGATFHVIFCCFPIDYYLLLYFRYLVAAAFQNIILLHFRLFTSAFQIFIAAFPIIFYYIPGIWSCIPKYYFAAFPIICVWIPDFYCCILHYLLLHYILYLAAFQIFGGAALQYHILLHFRLFTSAFQIFIAAFSIIYYCITYYIWLLSRLFVSGFQIFIAAFSIIYFYLPDLYCCILHYLLLSLFPIFHLCTSDICWHSTLFITLFIPANILPSASCRHSLRSSIGRLVVIVEYSYELFSWTPKHLIIVWMHCWATCSCIAY